MNDLLSEFFYEGIRRIFPGLVYLALYWHAEAAALRDGHKDFPLVLFSVCVLVIAWIIGFAIEQFLDLAVYGVWKFGGKHLLNKTRRLFRLQKRITARKLNESESSDDRASREKRRFLASLFAGRIMSRSLCAIFLFAWAASALAKPFWLIAPPEPFKLVQWKPEYSFCGCVVFFVIWFWMVVNDWKVNTRRKRARREFEFDTSESTIQASVWPALNLIPGKSAQGPLTRTFKLRRMRR